MTRKAAIISKDDTLIRLVKNELTLLDFEANSFTDVKDVLDDYDAVIVDSNISTIFPACNAKVKLSLRAYVSGANISLGFPFLLSDLRNAVSIYRETVGVNENKPEKDLNVISADKKSLTVRLLGTTVKLSQSEFIILEALCKKSGEYIPLSELNSMLGADRGNIAAVYICHLRRKLETPFGIRLIFTSGGKGYMTRFIMK